MLPLASLSKLTKLGHVSTWHFVKAPDGYYAFGGCDAPSHKPQVKRFATVKELRSLYDRYVREYGYHQVNEATQLELSLST